MCEALRELMKDEMEAELEKGRAQGLAQGNNAAFLADVESLAANMNMSVEEACIKLNRSYEEYLKIKNTL